MRLRDIVAGDILRSLLRPRVSLPPTGHVASGATLSIASARNTKDSLVTTEPVEDRDDLQAFDVSRLWEQSGHGEDERGRKLGP